MYGIIESPVKSLLVGLALPASCWCCGSPWPGWTRSGSCRSCCGSSTWPARCCGSASSFSSTSRPRKALAEADEPARAALQKWIVPPVAKSFRHASHLTLVSGIALLLTTGYLLDRWIFSSPVYIPPLRNLLLWGGTLASAAMWVFVNLRIWPNLRIVLGQVPADPAAVAVARETVRFYARLNLVLALPVTFVMVAAAHLY